MAFPQLPPMAPGQPLCQIETDSLPCSHVVTAVEHIRPMRGGSQPQLMRCSDGHYYVVKFRNNPQGSKILANEFVAGQLARLLGLPCPDTRLIEVKEDLVHLTPELRIQLPSSFTPVATGLAFGSQYPSERCGRKRTLLQVIDLRAALSIGRVENLADLLGMLVFDKWASNTDTRQIVCVPQSPAPSRTFRILMIDNGFCFNAEDWTFKDSAQHGLLLDTAVYSMIPSLRCLDAWLDQLNVKVELKDLNIIAECVPALWIRNDKAQLLDLMQGLFERKKIVSTLVQSALSALKKRDPQRFFWAVGAR